MIVSDKRTRIAIVFLAILFCTAFTDLIRVFSYFLFEIALVFTCVLLCVYVILTKKIVLLKHEVIIPYFLLIIWSVVEMFLFDGLKYAPKYFIYALLEIFIFVNVAIHFVGKTNYGDFIKYTCWAFIAFAFLLLGYYFSKGIFYNFNGAIINDSKYLIGLATVGSYYLLLRERKTVYAVLTYVFLVFSILSFIRKMWLALFVTFVIITILYVIRSAKILAKREFRHQIYRIAAILLAITLTGIMLFVLFPPLHARTGYILGEDLPQTEESDERYEVMINSDLFRRYLNQYAIDAIKKSPIIGNGWGDRLHVAEMNLNSLYHNVFLSAFAQLGIIGFVLYTGVYIYPLIRAIVILCRKRQYYDYGLLILALWLFTFIVLYYRPLNRMSYYLWGPPLIFTLIFDVWEAKKYLALDLHKRIAIKD